MGVEGLADLGQVCLRKRCYRDGAATREDGKARKGPPRGIPGRGGRLRGVGCPRVSDTLEPEVYPVSLESPGDVLTEDPGGVRCAEQ